MGPEVEFNGEFPETMAGMWEVLSACHHRQLPWHCSEAMRAVTLEKEGSGEQKCPQHGQACK